MKEGDFLTYPHPIITQVHQVMNTTWDAHMTPHSSGEAGGSGIQRGLKLVKSIWWFTLLVKFHAWQCLKVPLICSLRFDNIWKRTWCKSEVKLTKFPTKCQKIKVSANIASDVKVDWSRNRFYFWDMQSSHAHKEAWSVDKNKMIALNLTGGPLGVNLLDPKTLGHASELGQFTGIKLN